MEDADTPRQAYRLPVALLSGIVLAIAAAVFVVGWGLGVSAVKEVIPGAVAMKAATALGLAAGATAIFLLQSGATGRRRGAGRVLAAIPGVLGLQVLTEYAFGVRLGVDELLFVDHAGRAAGIAYPGRFAPSTAVCFVLLSAALLLLDAGRSWRWRPAEVFAVPLALVACMSLIGYSYSIPVFYGPAAATKMAVHTAFCFVLLAVAVVLSRPRGRLLEMATTTDPGGVMVRRLVPLCLVGPLVLGWLHLRAVAWGVFNAEVGAWWLAAITAGGLMVLLWWCAGTLSRADADRCQLESRLYELANRDQLTGLLNRHRFEEEVDEFLKRSRRYGDRGSLLLLDLDRMKAVNDSLGHHVGDDMLRGVADAATGRLRDSDALGRLGGDEFAVLLPTADLDAACQVAADLLAAIAAVAIRTDRGVGWTSASIGIVEVEEGEVRGVAELLNRADVAMYDAKRSGGNRFSVDLAPRASSVTSLAG